MMRNTSYRDLINNKNKRDVEWYKYLGDNHKDYPQISDYISNRFKANNMRIGIRVLRLISNNAIVTLLLKMRAFSVLSKFWVLL